MFDRGTHAPPRAHLDTSGAGHTSLRFACLGVGRSSMYIRRHVSLYESATNMFRPSKKQKVNTCFVKFFCRLVKMNW